MANGGDFDDLSWLYGDDQSGSNGGNGPATPRPKRSLADLYADEEMADMLPPLDGDLDSADDQIETPRAGLISRLFGGGKRSDEFAGVDTSEPTRKERKTRRRDGALIADQDDPFAKLVTPLSDAEVASLRAELSREEILFVKWKRQHRLAARWRTLGLLLSFAVIGLLALRFGHNYIDHNLKNPNSPKRLIKKLGKQNADAVTFALALLTPFLAIGLLTDFFEQTLRTFAMRSLKSLALAMLSALAIVVTGTMLAAHQPIMAAGTVLAWMVIRGLIRMVAGGRSGEL